MSDTAWITANWDPELTVGEWWTRLAEAGLAQPTWPVGLGGCDASGAFAREFGRLLSSCGALAPPAGVGQSMGGPTLIEHGSQTQVKQWVPALARGAEAWCQLFSEPGAGSDLASLQARAEPDGSGFRVTGQKVWNTGADRADRGLLLARTSEPKHGGITYFVIDMDQPGIEVRPLRQMNGSSEFCEVFLDEAWTDQVVGRVDDGWRVAKTTLAHERAGVSANRVLPGAAPGRGHGQLDRRAGDVVADLETAAANRKPGPVLSSRYLIALAVDMGRSEDPVVRQQLARLHSLIRMNRWTVQRARGRPGPEASVGKLAMSRIARASRSLALELMGPGGMLTTDAPDGGATVNSVLSSFSVSIGGGTDEIQRNQIGERVLGLPRDG